LEGDDRGIEARYKILAQGSSERRAIEIEYYTAGRDELNRRKVLPYLLAQYLGSWYVVGHDDKRDEIRIFKLERVKSARLLDERFDIPRSFKPQKYVRAGMFVGKKSTARILFRGDLARIMAEEYPPEQIERTDDATTVLTTEFSQPEWLAAWVMSF